jgi:predicted metal-dependent hydrolase
MYKVVEIDGVGPVLFKKDRRYKRLSMKVDAEARVIVNLPYNVHTSFAQDWVVEKKDWILKCTKKVQENKKKSTVFIPDTVYKTFRHRIEFVRSDKPGINLKTGDDYLVVSFSNNISEEDILKSETQAKLKGLVESVYKFEAQTYLIPRTKEIARELGFKHGRISVRNNKSRWGSCSGDDNISLNIHLMRLPLHLIDYVILHELCHTVEKNHSKKFWDLMEKVCTNSKGKRKELMQYSTVLY